MRGSTTAPRARVTAELGRPAGLRRSHRRAPHQARARWPRPQCWVSELLLDLQTCAAERVDESDLCVSLCPKDGSVTSTDEPEAKPAGQPEVGLDSGDVSKSDLHRGKKPIRRPARRNLDVVRVQFENCQWRAEIRATREEAAACAVPHSADESGALFGHEPSLGGAILRGTFSNTGPARVARPRRPSRTRDRAVNCASARRGAPRRRQGGASSSRSQSPGRAARRGTQSLSRPARPSSS